MVGVLWYAGHLIISHQMTGKNIISFVLYQFNMANVLNSLGSVYTGKRWSLLRHSAYFSGMRFLANSVEPRAVAAVLEFQAPVPASNIKIFWPRLQHLEIFISGSRTIWSEKQKKNIVLFVLLACLTNYLCEIGTQISGSGSTI